MADQVADLVADLFTDRLENLAPDPGGPRQSRPEAT